MTLPKDEALIYHDETPLSSLNNDAWKWENNDKPYACDAVGLYFILIPYPSVWPHAITAKFITLSVNYKNADPVLDHHYF